MSSHDSGRPPHPARRPVLRKIATPLSSTPPAPAASSPSTRPPVGREPSTASPPQGGGPGQTSSVSDAVPAPRRSAPRSEPSAPKLADASDPFELLAHPDRTSPGLGQILESRSSLIPAAPPTPSPSRPHAVGSTPSTDSLPGRTPLPQRARGSLPPVVASSAELRPTTLGRVAQVRSARRAGLVGGALGLAFVILFVVGARIAYRPAPQATTGAPLASVTTASGVTVLAPLPSATANVPRVALLPPAPEPQSPPPPVVRSQPRRAAPGGRPALVATAAAKLPFPTGGSQDTPQPPDPSEEAPNGVAPSTATARAEPASSAPSLVPVIPTSSPPELDPLVKAVLEEDEPKRK
jgi:hypothetical protein